MHPTIKPITFGTLAEIKTSAPQGWWLLLDLRKEWGHVSRIRRIGKRKKL